MSDVTKSVSESYGVLIPSQVLIVSLEIIKLNGWVYKLIGKIGGFQGVALRGLFIIDKEGVIQHSTINNLAIGRSVDETLRTLQVIISCR